MQTVTQHKSPVEYRDVNNAKRSRTNVLDKGIADKPKGPRVPHEWTLTHHTAGYECAGSMARWTNEKWAVRFVADGATHGRSFLTEHEACEWFAMQTGRAVVS